MKRTNFWWRQQRKGEGTLWRHQRRLNGRLIDDDVMITSSEASLPSSSARAARSTALPHADTWSTSIAPRSHEDVLPSAADICKKEKERENWVLSTKRKGMERGMKKRAKRRAKGDRKGKARKARKTKRKSKWTRRKTEQQKRKIKEREKERERKKEKRKEQKSSSILFRFHVEEENASTVTRRAFQVFLKIEAEKLPRRAMWWRHRESCMI